MLPSRVGERSLGSSRPPFPRRLKSSTSGRPGTGESGQYPQFSFPGFDPRESVPSSQISIGPLVSTLPTGLSRSAKPVPLSRVSLGSPPPLARAGSDLVASRITSVPSGDSSGWYRALRALYLPYSQEISLQRREISLYYPPGSLWINYPPGSKLLIGRHSVPLCSTTFTLPPPPYPANYVGGVYLTLVVRVTRDPSLPNYPRPPASSGRRAGIVLPYCISSPLPPL